MFYFLIIIGFIFIILGIVYKDKREKSPLLPPNYKQLEKRISDMEKLLFEDLLEHEMLDELSPVEEVRQDLSREEELIRKYTLLKRYERENKSIEEICRLLNMQKGEVFLLKNLYKD